MVNHGDKKNLAERKEIRSMDSDSDSGKEVEKNLGVMEVKQTL